jgi:tetratricopeptide (TPR) repeat protein/glycosyltransferase involved in cell wall biosynthesis
MHYLGRELLYTRRYASAVQVLQRHIAMDRWKAEKAQSMIYLGDCLGGLGQPDEQAEWYFRAFHTDPTRREALLRLAGFYQHNRQATAVAAFAAAAMEIPWHAFYANLVAQYRDEPHAFRYWGRGWLGNIQGAQEDLLKCLEWNPFNATYLEHTKYYFPYADRLIDGWMLYPELLWLYETAERMQSVVEVGSWKGRSTHAIASGCRRGEVWAVDHFRGSKGEEVQHAEAANPENIYRQFLNNTEELNNLHILRMGSLEAAERFDDHSVDMVFIDAGHTYEDVKADIEAWLPKARILIAGHDFAPEWPGVRRAVTERFGQVGKHKTIWYRYVKEPLVSIIIPTLGREEQLQRLINLIETNAGWPLYEVLVEVDDWPPNNQGVPRLVQRGVARARGELIMYLGTDCEPQRGFLLEAVHAMLRHFPAYDGLIGLNDGIYTSGQVATHWLAGKALLPLLDGEFFHTGYHHVGCDNELTARCRKLRRYVWCEQARINHQHFSVTGKELDETYRVGWQPELVERDRALLRRRAEQLGLDIEVDMRPRKIPRRAFSIWLGEEPPELVKVCLSSHRERLKGWEYRLLTLDNTRWIEDAYFRRAVEAKRWVKAADRLRLLELQRNGGVYLDADMELLTEIPHSLLVPSMLVAREENGFIANSVIGAVPGHPTLGRVLQRMEQADPEDDKVFENGMEIFSREVDASIAEGDQDILVVGPSVFFPFNHQTHKTTFTEKTIAYHHFMKSWAGGDD